MDSNNSISSLHLFNEDDEIINIDEINWSDDETWLTKTNQPKSGDLNDFFDTKYDSDNDVFTVNLPGRFKIDKLSKHIDTRTFTRPKKRLTTNIEEFYRIEDESILKNLVENDSVMFSSPTTTTIIKKHPEQVQFDLTASSSSTSGYFDNINADGTKSEYLENMSPPSLVNSLCSSTFATLMENSFIKNDPILREIRDTDYTQTVLLEDVEPILFQSISDSCCDNSNLDTNKIDQQIVEKPPVQDDDLNATFTKDNIDNEPNLTYQKTNDQSYKIDNNATPYKSCINETLLDNTMTFDRSKSPRLLNRRQQPSLDLLNNSKIHNDNNDRNHQDNNSRNSSSSSNNTTITNENDRKINSLNCSTDSENVEFMSISSGGSSSKDSYKMLNMDGINAIVEMQERSLQMMSTPIVEKRAFTFVLNDKEFSPITSGNSNPELSSNNYVELDDINPIIQTPPIQSTTIRKIDTTTLMRKPKIPSNRLQYTGANIRSSHPNLKMMDDNTRTITATTTSNNIRRSNLNTMGCTLKGSYTSLKPINTNLPIAPPLNTTIIHSKAQNTAQTNNQDSPVIKDNETFVKPQLPRFSGLPRPISTGIPRPVSRIPAPKSVRSLAKPVGLSGRKP